MRGAGGIPTVDACRSSPTQDVEPIPMEGALQKCRRTLTQAAAQTQAAAVHEAVNLRPWS